MISNILIYSLLGVFLTWGLFQLRLYINNSKVNQLNKLIPTHSIGYYFNPQIDTLIKLEEADEVTGILFSSASKPFIKMPCGNIISFSDIDMRQDVPCPCGNPQHWVFRKIR